MEESTKKHDRVLEIYSRLLSGEVVQRGKLAEEYGVTPRSIQRDISFKGADEDISLWSVNRTLSLNPNDKWVDPQILQLNREGMFDGKSLIIRAKTGWRIIKHVFAAAVEAEDLHSFNDSEKKAANAVCRYLGIPEIYVRKTGGERGFYNYGVGCEDTSRMILTPRMIEEAAIRFGFRYHIDETKKVIVEFEKGSIYFD